MLDVEKIRQDFPMLNGATMHGQPLIYFDNGATTLKPQCVIDAVCNYLTTIRVMHIVVTMTYRMMLIHSSKRHVI